MSKIQNLIDQRAKIKSEMDSILKSADDSEKGLSDEQELAFDKAYDDFEKLTGDIQRMEKMAEINSKFEDSKEKFVEAQREDKRTPAEKYAEAFEKKFRGFNLTDEEKGLLVTGYSRAQSTSDGAGGYTIPTDTEASILEVMAAYGPFGVNDTPATVLRTASGNKIEFPKNDDTANKGRLLAEAADASSGATDLVFTNFELDAYKYTSDLILVNYELIQDSAVNFPAFLADALGTRLGRIYNEHLTTGTGSSQPEGIVTGASEGKVTTSSTAITQAELNDLRHSVDPAYRNSNTRWMFNDAIIKEIMKLDTSASNYSQPVWQPSFAAGQPDTVLGYQYLVNQDMASSLAAGNKVALFGDISKFYIRLVEGMRLKQLNERYGETDQVAWVGFSRFDSVVADSNAIKYLQCAT